MRTEAWEEECQALRHANRMLRDGHEAAKVSEYERGRRDMMQEILRLIRKRTDRCAADEVLEYHWPKESR
jgi:hypothetical protein